MPDGPQGLGGDRQSGVHGDRTRYRRAVDDEQTVMGVGKLRAAPLRSTIGPEWQPLALRLVVSLPADEDAAEACCGTPSLHRCL